MNDKEEIGTMKEQKVAIDNLEAILHFLKSVQIKDDDIIVNIKKPLDNLKSSLKYIPTESFFETIPTEIKTKILNNLCDSNAFIAAAVCLDWKQILGSRFTERKVTIGESCCDSQCRDNMCSLSRWRGMSRRKNKRTNKQTRKDIEMSNSHLNYFKLTRVSDVLGDVPTIGNY